MIYLDKIKIYTSLKKDSVSFHFFENNVFWGSLTLVAKIYPSKWEVFINNFLEKNDAILIDENFYKKIKETIKEIKKC